MLDYIDDFTIRSIEFINFLILFFWFGYTFTMGAGKILNNLFGLNRRKRYE
jgi:hypothetical protein